MKNPRSSFVDDLVRALRWRRRPLAAVAAAIAVFCVVIALQPPSPATVGVVTVTRDLPGGTVLAQSDVEVTQLPPGSVPGAALTDAGAAVGRTINGPLTRLSAVTEATVASGQQLARPGFVVAALPLTDAAIASVLRVGAHIDIIGPAGGKVGVVASDVRVVAVPQTASEGLGGFSGSERVALVELKPQVAAQLAGATQAGDLTLTLR
ncbi:SAF domain-containing protein [Nigerium massiliense]|uniref:SAF domain-containing protein n=1 Tax=Nigerium massiliense TaxID=1522317 RepID=UPI0005906C74|nr:SAF domain-containing protein [Nigerium massiliense]